jgi:hypothetical protein
MTLARSRNATGVEDAGGRRRPRSVRGRRFCTNACPAASTPVMVWMPCIGRSRRFSCVWSAPTAFAYRSTWCQLRPQRVQDSRVGGRGLLRWLEAVTFRMLALPVAQSALSAAHGRILPNR